MYNPPIDIILKAVSMLSVKDIRSYYPAKIEYNEHNIVMANIALDFMWQERCKERGEDYSGDRSGSCKFAALLSRNLFGGCLAGNDDHVFTMTHSELIDLNIVQRDVIALNHMAHVRFDHVLSDKDYRAALTSCLPRVERWEKWLLGRINL